MKISVIMIDGGFRENVFGAEYFSNQAFDVNEFEIIWVEYYNKPNRALRAYPHIKVIRLNQKGNYHSSMCFNRGIIEANGELLIIPDADVIVKSDFLEKVWNIHQAYEKLIVYAYRYDEMNKGSLKSVDFDELEKKCVLKNPLNYGGCLTVRRKWMETINGYEQHPVFGSGFHANGLDLYTRFKNLGMAVQWNPDLKLYHPWHKNTYFMSPDYYRQFIFIKWRQKVLSWKALSGIDPSLNQDFKEVDQFIEKESKINFRIRRYLKKMTDRYFKKQIWFSRV